MSTASPIIAIVEDDASLLKGLARLLETLGFATELYCSAEDYLARVTASNATCLLLDIDLGGLSGIELGRHLAASGSQLPVIFMTALQDEKTQKEAMATGCVAYLQKPFPASALIEALNKAA